MRKIWWLVISVVSVGLLAGGGHLVWRIFFLRPAPPPSTVTSPSSLKKVNELELAKRPFVALLPHPDPSQCSGVDLVIENLKNGETLAEYEMEYNAGPLIQGVFGRREFTKQGAIHQPLLFGSCSKSKCKCDQDISGGNLTLNFMAKEDYALKSDFTLQTVGEAEKLGSTDARLSVAPGTALPKGTEVIIMKTMGLPAELTGEVVAGPYGIFVPQGVTARGEMPLVLQGKEEGKLMFWNGKTWQELKAEVSDGKISSAIPNVGVVVLVK